jgi:WD40 repeat protein
MYYGSISTLCGLCLLTAIPQQYATAGEKKGQPGGLEFGKNRPMLVAQLGHLEPLNAAFMSGDGKWLVTGSQDSTARLWEVATGREVRVFRGHTSGVFSASLSADRKWLVTGSPDKSARMWEVATGKEIRAFLGHSDGINSVHIFGDGKWLVTGSNDNTARLWEVATGKEARVFRGHADQVSSMAVSSDEKWLVTASWDKTVRLWEVATGKEVRAFTGHSSYVHCVSLSKDGKWLISGGLDAARLWNVSTGEEVRVFHAHPRESSSGIRSVSFSVDGKLLAISDYNSARLLEVASGKELRSFVHDSLVWSVSLSPDSQWLIASSWDTARLWNVATGREVRAFRGLSAVVSGITVSHDAKYLVTGSNEKPTDRRLGGPPRLWDVGSGKEIGKFHGYSDAVALSGDGMWLVTGSDDTLFRFHRSLGETDVHVPKDLDTAARLWEVATGKEVRAFRGHSFGILSVSLSGDSKWLATGSVDKTARLWEVATGKEVRVFRGHSAVKSVSLSRDGNWLITGGDDIARLWDVATGKEVRVFRGHSGYVTSVALSSDGKWLVTGSWDKTARLWEVSTGKEVRAFPGHTSFVRCVSMSDDGKLLVTASWDTVQLWEVSTGKKLHTFRGHSSSVECVCLSRDGRWLFTGGRDYTTRLWDVATGKELCRLISLRDGSWAVIDAAGRFDASNGGNVEGLHWVAGTETIALNQLKERYYDPGLLAKHMGFNKEPLRNVQAFRDVKLHPHVEAEPPALGSSKLNLKLANRGGGIGKVQVFVNGRELLADARGPNPNPDAATATTSVDLAGAVALPGEKNHVRIVTWNAEGYLSSRGLDLDWEPPGHKDAQPMELHAIVVGVSTYDSDALKLRFAAKDAADVAKALELGGKRLFGADKTHVTLLCDGAISPTRANLEKAFEAARKCRPTDVLVVYLAGHGIALQEKDQEVYCYLTKDARTVNQDQFKDPDVRRQYSLTSTELTEWFKKIPALKQVLILDTCAAGAAAKKLIEHRDVSADQIRAIDRLRNRTGFHVLMGCASDRVSYEASQYSQGLLTYSLLQGMRGAKLREGEYVDVMDLFQYAADQVPQLARNIGGIQKPLILAPRGTSFDIGRLKDADKKLIPLALVRPLVLRPLLQNADESVLDDDLGLMPLLRKRLIEQGYAPARGAGSQSAVFVDADEMPGAIRPTGKYTIEGKTVQVRVLLRQDGKTIGVVQVEGRRDQLDALSDRLTAAIAAKLKTP